MFVCRKGPVIEEVKADGNRISLESFLTQINYLHALFVFLKQLLQLLGCACEAMYINTSICQLATLYIIL